MHLSPKVGSAACDSELDPPPPPPATSFLGTAQKTPWRWHLSDGQGRGTVQPQHFCSRSHGKGGGCLSRVLTNAGAHSGQKFSPATGLTRQDPAGAGSVGSSSWRWCWGIICEAELEERPENLHCVGSISGGFINRVSPNFARDPRLSAINSASSVHCGVFFCIAFF